MTVNAADLLAYVGASLDDSTAVGRAFNAAKFLLDRHVANSSMPEEVYDFCLLEVGSELFKRKDSPSGNSQFADMSTGFPIKAPRDPLTTVYPIILGYARQF